MGYTQKLDRFDLRVWHGQLEGGMEYYQGQKRTVARPEDEGPLWEDVTSRYPTEELAWLALSDS